MKDPPFLGARLTFPIADQWKVEGEWDRDINTAAPKWEAHVGLIWKPFGR